MLLSNQGMQMEQKPIRILVVDDEPFIRELLDEYLSMNGYQVSTAGNGGDAVAKFKTDMPHMVFLDVNMPGMSGLDVLCKIKEIDPASCVTMLSAFGDDYSIEEISRLRADYFIQKPVKLEKLLEFLVSWQASRDKRGSGDSS